MVLVSVIVPIYNAGKYLNECINSVLNQTYSNIQLILIDDGSIDNSKCICEAYQKKDSRVFFYTQSNNGVSSARNAGLKVATGEYICFLDADDFIDLDFVEIMVTEIESNTVDAVFCSHKNNYKGVEIKRKPRIKDGLYKLEDLKRKLIDDGTLSGILFGSVCGGIYKSKIINECGILFQEDIKINEDGIFNIDYCLHSSLIRVASDKHLYSYRQNDNSATHSYHLESRTRPATIRIIEKYGALNDDKLVLEHQLGTRSISEAFWEILNLCNNKNPNSYYAIVKKIADVLSAEELKCNYKYMAYYDTNLYKRVCIILMKYRCSIVLFILIRFLYPLLVNRVSR